MILATDIQQLAVRQVQDYRARTPGTCFADAGFGLDVSEAYAVQDAMTKLRVAEGEHVAGYKVGCTGPGTTAQFGMAGPIRGTLFTDEIRDDGTVLAPEAFCNLAIEGEMALQIGHNGAIAAVFPVIELHNFVFRAPEKNLSELIANNGLNAGVMLPAKSWRASKTYLERPAALSVRINGEVFDTDALWPMPGGAGGSLDWLEDHLAAHDLQLSNGDLVLAGTTLGLYPVHPGDAITVYLDHQPALQCSIAQ
jgi:2-keto-4-pentenoate hydratase